MSCSTSISSVSYSTKPQTHLQNWMLPSHFSGTIFCNVFYIHCSNSQWSKDFFRACFTSAEVTSRCDCFWAISDGLFVVTSSRLWNELSVKSCSFNCKEVQVALECRAAAVFSKDSRSFIANCVQTLSFFFFPNVLLVLEHTLKMIYHKKRGKYA